MEVEWDAICEAWQALQEILHMSAVKVTKTFTYNISNNLEPSAGPSGSAFPIATDSQVSPRPPDLETTTLVQVPSTPTELKVKISNIDLPTILNLTPCPSISLLSKFFPMKSSLYSQKS